MANGKFLKSQFFVRSAICIILTVISSKSFESLMSRAFRSTSVDHRPTVIGRDLTVKTSIAEKVVCFVETSNKLVFTCSARFNDFFIP